MTPYPDEENPPILGRGYNLTLDTGEVCYECWFDGADWWTGVQGDPLDRLITETIVYWEIIV